MNILTGEIITIVTPAGEFVGRCTNIVDGQYTMADPKMFINSEEGMGFLPGVSMTGMPNPTEVVFHMVIAALPASPDSEKAWLQATSGLILQ